MATPASMTSISRRNVIQDAACLGLLGSLAALNRVGAVNGRSIAASPAAELAPSIETLLELDLPSTVLADAQYAVLCLHLVAQLASSSTWLHENKGCQMGADTDGELTLTVAGRTEIFRTDGKQESAEGGETVSIGRSDGFAVYEFTQPQIYANTGATEAHFFTVEFNRLEPIATNDQLLAQEGADLGFPRIADFLGNYWEPYGLSGRDLRVSLRRLTFAPGAAYRSAGDQAMVQFVDEGTLELVSTMADGRVIEPRQMTGNIFTSAAGTKRESVLTNRTETPSILIEALFTPIDEPATPTA